MSTFGPRTEWTIAAVDDAPSGGRKGTFVRLLLHTTSPSTDNGSGAPRQALRRLRRARLAWQGGVGGTCWGPRARSSRGEGASASAHARALSCEGWVLAATAASGRRPVSRLSLIGARPRSVSGPSRETRAPTRRSSWPATGERACACVRPRNRRRPCHTRQRAGLDLNSASVLKGNSETVPSILQVPATIPHIIFRVPQPLDPIYKLCNRT